MLFKIQPPSTLLGSVLYGSRCLSPSSRLRFMIQAFRTPEVCFVSASIPISLFNTPCQKGDMSFPSVNLSGALASPGNTCFTFTDLMKVIASQSS